MTKNTFFKKTKYSAALTLGLAGAMATSPILAQSEIERQNQQNADSASSITVDEAAPRVQLEQPAPKVTAQQSKTKVEVETGEPEVSVDQPKPEVSVEQPEPEVSISQSEPNVKINEAQPQVDVNQAEPEVTVNTAEPEVNIINKDEEGKNKQSQQSGSSQSLAQTPLDELQGKKVVTANGEELGSVQDIVADQQGNKAGLVVSVGGFFGIGDTQILVPANETELTDDQIVWQTSRSPDQLERTNEYRSDQYQSVTDRYDTLSEAREAQVSGLQTD